MRTIDIKPYLLAIIMLIKIKYLSEMSRHLKEISQSQLTALLNKDLKAESIWLKIGERFYNMSEWYLLIDDTVIEKPYQKQFKLFSWVFDHKKNKKVRGICVVYAVLTNGRKVIPLYSEVYQKGGPTRIEIALRFLSQVRNDLKIKPSAVLFDSWYSDGTILKRINDYGWRFITQIKKNRKVDKKQIRDICITPYMSYIGYLKNGVKVKVCRNLKKYYTTNRLTNDRKEILLLYKKRQMIEQFFKDLKSYFCLGDLSMKSAIAWKNHLSLCTLAYLVVSCYPGLEDLPPSKIKQRIVSQEIPFGLEMLNSILGL